jgi:hypothetical protein
MSRKSVFNFIVRRQPSRDDQRDCGEVQLEQSTPNGYGGRSKRVQGKHGEQVRSEKM